MTFCSRFLTTFLFYHKQEPVEHGKWKSPLIANQSYVCAQVIHTPDPVGGLYIGQEDCLYLNVFVPGNVINPSKNYDVLFMIHGGGFTYGMAHMTGPKFLMDRNVILVTFNYRLGVLGFMSTEDKYMPGNLGMKDQIMALKWVNKYIESFGGNPNSITVTGLSAGGVSAEFMLMSPLSKGLFQRAISMSGTVLMAWSIQDKPLDKVRRVAKVLKCNSKSTKEIVKCMKRQPLQKLVESIRVLRSFLYNPFSPVGVVVDCASDKPFLPRHPYTMLQNGKIILSTNYFLL